MSNLKLSVSIILFILLLLITFYSWACDPSSHDGEDGCQPCYRAARVLYICIGDYADCPSYQLKQPVECVPVCDPSKDDTCPIAEYIRIQEHFDCNELGNDYFVYDGKCVKKTSVVCPPGYSVGQTSDGTEARYDVCVKDSESGVDSGTSSNTGGSSTGSDSGGSGSGGSGTGGSGTGGTGGGTGTTDPTKHYENNGSESECVLEEFQEESDNSCDCSIAQAQCEQWASNQCNVFSDGQWTTEECRTCESLSCSVRSFYNSVYQQTYQCINSSSPLCSNSQRSYSLSETSSSSCSELSPSYGCEEGAPSEAPSNPGDPYDEDECLASGCTWVGVPGGWGQCHCFDSDGDGQQDPGDGDSGDGDGGGDGTADCPEGYISMNGGCLKSHSSEIDDLEGEKIQKLDEIARRISESNGTLKDLKEAFEGFGSGIIEKLDELSMSEVSFETPPDTFSFGESQEFQEAQQEFLDSFDYIRSEFNTDFQWTGSANSCSLDIGFSLWGENYDLGSEFCTFFEQLTNTQYFQMFLQLFNFMFIFLAFRIIFIKR